MNRRGMSLIEAILALTVMALVTLLVANLFPALGFTIKRSENRFQADSLAVSILQNQAARPFEELTPAPPTTLPSVEREGTTFRPELEVFPVPGTLSENVVGLRVTVRWEERGGPREVIHENWIPDVNR